LKIFQNLRNIIEKIEYTVKIGHEKVDSQYIYFEKITYIGGTEHITFLLEAIENKVAVEFDYHAYDKEAPVHRVFHPYVLKEHSDRWYVIGWLPQFGAMVTYALDRILDNTNRRYLHEGFKIQEDFDVLKYLEYTYGITKADGPVEDIILEFQYLQGRYFLSKPFYKYEVIRDTPESLIIKMRLIVNFELVRKLCSFTEAVKVLQPAHLADMIAEKHRKALAHYE